MWESKDQTLDINYNVAELWFIGVYGQPVPKPIDIKKWECENCRERVLNGDASHPLIDSSLSTEFLWQSTSHPGAH